MMEIESIWLRREGGENDPHATVVVLVKRAALSEDTKEEWEELIREPADGCFSHIANLPGRLR